MNSGIRALATALAALLPVTFGLLLTVQAAAAQQTSRSAIESGKNEFNKYCAACHGQDAKGIGPLGKILKAQIPDLTLIYKKNKGVFPIGVVVDIVEGDYPIEAHGGREMPLWGDAFRSEGGTNYDARGRILGVVLYLHSIQER